MITRWDSPEHIAWNSVAAVVWVLGIVRTLAVPASRLPRGWISKAGALAIAILLTIYAAGFFFPFGAAGYILVPPGTGFRAKVKRRASGGPVASEADQTRTEHRYP